MIFSHGEDVKAVDLNIVKHDEITHDATPSKGLAMIP